MQIKCYVKKKNLRKSWLSYADGGIVAFSCLIRWRFSLKMGNYCEQHNDKKNRLRKRKKLLECLPFFTLPCFSCCLETCYENIWDDSQNSSCCLSVTRPFKA